MDITNIIYAGAVLAAVGIIFGIILTVASKKLAVKEDSRIGEIKELLGGANCGGCGYPGCDGFAKAVVEGSERIEKCSVMSPENAKKAGEILGIEVGESVPRAARLVCQGSTGIAKEKFIYDGVSSCRLAASLAGGPKQCEFACIGLGDCVNACKFGAISIKEGTAFFDESRCMGCGECEKVCPRKAIGIMPKDKRIFVACRNTKSGKEAKSQCLRACIGCGRCKKECEHGAITVENSLARIDFDKCVGCGKCAEVCPCKCIVNGSVKGII